MSNVHNLVSPPQFNQNSTPVSLKDFSRINTLSTNSNGITFALLQG